MEAGIFIGKGDIPVYLDPKFGNRHGLITGATGTGKTVTLQVIAEGFAKRGTPVFLADVKGDLTGLCQVGGGNEKLEARAKEIGATLEYQKFSTRFWDVFGKQGHPIRATVSEMGPLLLSRMLDLNDVQEGVLNLAFKMADDNGFLLLDLKDLRAMLVYLADNADDIQKEYGNVAAQSVGAIQRNLLVLEEQGGNLFFGEPALQLSDFMACDSTGKGYINVLAASQLINSPRLYSTFLLWLLSELFEELPEAGDLPQPKLVFFFDEAHLLFNDAPQALVEKVEQVVRLIRSKGVGVYFVTQNPLDVPDTVLGQLGNRVQHALRAFTPREQKAVQTAADTFRPNPKFNTADVITNLGVGEALVSTLEEKGIPMIVQKTLICPPTSHLGPATITDWQGALASDGIGTRYDHTEDRESAYETLKKRADEKSLQDQARVQAEAAEKAAEAEQKAAARAANGGGRRSDTMVEAIAKSVLRSAGSTLGRQIIRGVLGSMMKR